MYRLREDGTHEIVYDIFLHIFHLLSELPEVNFVETLLRCSLVSREWANFTVPLLYDSVDLSIRDPYYGITTTLDESSKASRVLRLLQSDTTYFSYRDFVRNLKMPALLLVPYKSRNEIELGKWMATLKSMSLEPLALNRLQN